MTHSARSWDTVKRRNCKNKSWKEWKKMIMDHFGTPTWKRKMAMAFDRDTFKWENREKPTAWLLLQRRRMDAAWPFLTISEQIDKVLSLCNGDIEHAVQSRIIDRSDFESFIIIFEDVVTNTSVCRSLQKMRDNRSSNFTRREGASGFKDYKSTEHPKSQEPGKYRDYKQSKTPSGNTGKVAFRNDNTRGGRFEKRPIHAISNDTDAEYGNEDLTDKSDEIGEEGSESSEDDELDLCVGNIDMIGTYQENESVPPAEQIVEETVQIQEPTLSIKDLAKNLRIAEEANLSVIPPPFIERDEFESPESRIFVAISISGFSSNMLLNTGIEPSVASTKVLNRYWPTWRTDMKTVRGDDMYSKDRNILGNISIPIKLEHAHKPCFLAVNFRVLNDDSLDHMILGSRDLREFRFSMHLKGRSCCKIRTTTTNETFKFPIIPQQIWDEAYETYPQNRIATITVEYKDGLDIAELQSQASIPQVWEESEKSSSQVSDARLMMSKPERGRAHTTGQHCITSALLSKGEKVEVLLDSGAAMFYSCTTTNDR
ncbi:uncharacterized protein MELLADRAFT_108378 [Melampsora larici-populina 98AG31]|uniref:Uncharacterized protein n=1 Tax=Melampsora larici-populina (strain 98AG31 / pathotype 3-4-7) TaxID=747676 RepID=F4RSX1_MELLP|nr:uncharacterized protein MELLADRAFT_108378 [Melampsora larici-populina 98AG31]EGG04403.1 hypothetical protein MELLADRAFT_108378 [Melampsora larici-populina 98AG31]